MKRLNPISYIVFMIHMVFMSCTNVSFQPMYSNPKGIDLSTGNCLVNELDAPVSKESNTELTAIMMKSLNEICGGTVSSVNAVTASGFTERIPYDGDSALLARLGGANQYRYFISVRAKTGSESTPGDGLVSPETNDQVILNINVYDIQESRMAYKQKVQATEFQEKETGFTFYRSTENLIKNAMVSGLKDLKRSSKRYKE
jgi:hypothetical protein